MSGNSNQVTVVALSRRNLDDMKGTDATFEVTSRIVPQAGPGGLSYSIEPVGENYTKSYLDNDIDYAVYMDSPDRAAYVAYLGDRTAGHIVLHRNWNRFGWVEDIRVVAGYRGRGVGTKLIEAAVAWAKGGGMPGLMLETQDNNVPAVKFYESCGFKLGGFDSYLYKGVNPNSNETALFWYLIF